MNSVQKDGLFWLPHDPGKEVGGRLTFSPQNGLELHLLGSLRSNPNSRLHNSLPLLIHGVTKSTPITLGNCLLKTASESIGSGGLTVISETYRPGLVLDGEHFQDIEALKFDQAYIGLFNLNQWVWRNGVTLSDESIVYSPPEELSVGTEFGQLGLVAQSEFIHGVTRTYTLKVSRLLKLVLAQPIPVDSITKFASQLQDLLTICTCNPSAVESLAVANSGSQQRVGVLRNMIGPDLHELKVEHPASMYLTFDDIGGMECVRAWLEISTKYGIVPRLLVDHTYNKDTYVDIRFLNTVIAAETLLRVRTNKRKIKLREGLQQLAEESGTVASDLVGDIGLWAENVRTTRNALVHRDVAKRKEPDYFALAESVYWIVVMSMLRECGVPDTALSKVRNTRWFEHTRSYLRWS